MGTRGKVGVGLRFESVWKSTELIASLRDVDDPLAPI